VNRILIAILGVMAALVVAVGVLIVVLVASGDDNGEPGQSANETQEPGATDEPDDGNGAPAEGELRLAGPEPITLDPHLAQDAGSAIYIVEIFDGLVTLDPDLQVQPNLAEALPEKTVNPDGTVTYRFRLRPNLTFHDRKPVTADIVKCSFERAADPATQSLVSEFFLGDIVGVKERLRNQAGEISGIRVVDSTTLEITIERDLPSFLFKLTYPTAFVVDPQQVGGECAGRDHGDGDPNWTRRPNGTGPYKLDQWRLGERIILEANDNYHLGAPNVKTVRYLLAGAGITLYESDDIDATGVGLNDLERVQDPADPLNTEYRSGSRLALDYIGFNTNEPPFDDVNVRRAFAMAIDRDQIARAIFQDAIPVANSILMPGMPGYNPDARAPEFNPQAARDLLANSPYGGPEGLPEITLAESGTGATAGEGTSAIVEMWRDNLGVDVQIQQAEVATFFQDVAQGRYQAFALGWIMDYPDPENILNIHFDSESPNNDTFYRNDEVDQLLREALVEPDAQRRIELYQQAEQIILDEVPWVPLFFDRYHVLIKPYVEDYLIPPTIVPRLRYITLGAR
jgi:oligopeptide transport system substrate-binding protein